MKTYGELARGDRICLDGVMVVIEDVWLYGEDEERVSLVLADGSERFGSLADEGVEVLPSELDAEDIAYLRAQASPEWEARGGGGL